VSFLCPKCHAAPASAGVTGGYRCGACGAHYPELHGVPILVPDARITTRPDLPPETFARQVASVVRDAPEAALSELRRAFAIQFGFADPVIQSESVQFLSRLRSSGIGVDDPYPPAQTQSAEAGASFNDRARLRMRGAALCALPPFPPSTIVSFNVRLWNTGDTTLSSRRSPPARLAYHIAAACPGAASVEGHRTEFLIDLPPGRGITQPMRVQTPDAPGIYRLTVQPLIESVTWFDPLFEVELEVAEAPAPEVAWNTTGALRDYGADHNHAVELLRGWLPKGGGDTLRIIEIGGNLFPSTAGLGRQAYNLDVDPYGLMTAAILKTSPRLTHLVADGTNLPFPDGHFDAIAMFATFHHFPDPAGLLRHLRTKLADHGRLFLMCEPIAHVFAEHGDGPFIRELEHGAYEQAFLPWEYADLARQADLEIADNVMDQGSAKIVLRKRAL
jgi:SAM-dependent methyltransferase